MKRLVLYFVLLVLSLPACVDAFEPAFDATVNVVVVDGTITNLAEPQVVRLNRSKADPLTGRFGTLPFTGVRMTVVVDGSQLVAFHETEPGRYQGADGFRGEPGHRYQLRFTLADGTTYQSAEEVMPAPVPLGRVSHQFNPLSLPEKKANDEVNIFRGAHELYVDWQDPADTRNYYRWDYKLWERQAWCRTCAQGVYVVWNVNDEAKLLEDCYYPQIATQIVSGDQTYFVNDYLCRGNCWEILRNYDLNLFTDDLTNGGLVTNRRVAQIPYYQRAGCLVEVRQSSLTKAAHTFFALFADQTQKTGGLADTPPAPLVGNVRNVANDRENVVGYFAATGVSVTRHWLDRNDATGLSPGLFEAINNLKPSPEGVTDPNTGLGKFSISFGGSKNSSRPPTAVCVDSDTRTPNKPEGWRD